MEVRDNVSVIFAAFDPVGTRGVALLHYIVVCDVFSRTRSNGSFVVPPAELSQPNTKRLANWCIYWSTAGLQSKMV